MKTYTVLQLNGESAVNIAKKFQGGYCYRGIYNHGKRIAQLEVVVDEPGEYNGFPNKWVDVSVIGHHENDTIAQLEKLGFGGQWVLISTCEEKGCYSNMTSHGWMQL